jgi:hypothetical protein
MQTSPVQVPPQSKGLTIAQFIISGLGLVGGIMGAGFFLLLGSTSLMGSSSELSNTTALFSMVWINGLTAILATPSLFFSLQRLRGLSTNLPRSNGLRAATIAILLWPLVLALGSWASGQSGLTWLIFPPLQLLAVGLPVWWVVEFARRRLSVGSPQRGWGIMNFSLLITTPLVVIVEIIIFAILLGIFAIWLMGRPELIQTLESLGQSIIAAQSSPELILPLLTPYLQNPIIILCIVACLSGLVPLIEELLKPLAIWLLSGHRLTPGEGFAAGALCGGAFALLESLLSLTNPVQQGWVLLAAGRAGTGLLHTTTTALIGWAMASAWQNHTYLRLGLTYLLAAGLHGLWNAFSLFWGLSSLFETPSGNFNFLVGLAQSAPAALICLVLIFLALLWGVNRHLQKTTLKPAPILFDPTQFS